MRQKLPVWAQSGDWHKAMIIRRIFASKLPSNVFWVLIRRGLDQLGGRWCRGHAIPTPSLQLHPGGWDTNSGGLFSNVQLYTLYSGPIKPVVRIVKLNFVLFVCLCALIVRQGGGWVGLRPMRRPECPSSANQRPGISHRRPRYWQPSRLWDFARKFSHSIEMQNLRDKKTSIHMSLPAITAR